jgi:uncharacterized protein (DUF1499 family)
MPVRFRTAAGAPDNRPRRPRRYLLALVLFTGLLILAAFWEPLTRNWAELAPDARDPELRAVELPYAPHEAVERVTSLIATLPRWMIVTVHGPDGTIHAAHTTRFWHFVDDVRLKFEPLGAGRCRMIGQSRARIGKADFGQNARNLKELRSAVLTTLSSASQPAAGPP